MGRKYIIRKITDAREKKELAEELTELLRDEDRREITAGGRSAYDEVHDSIHMSAECYAAFAGEDRTLIAVWGYRRVKGADGRLIWCLGTYQIKRYWLPFAVESKRIIARWARRFGVLYNAVGAFNHDTIRWLEWCGAVFHEEVKVGDEVFLPFTIGGG